MARNTKWYIDAQKSSNPEIKELLTRIEADPESESAAEWVAKIKEILLAEKSIISKTETTGSKNVQEQPESGSENVESAENAQKQESAEFPYTEDYIRTLTDDEELNKVIRACEAEMKKIDENRKRKENAHQKADVLTQQWKYTRMIWIARGVMRDKKRKIKQEMQAKTVGKLAQKRAIFCSKTRRGISISNIIGEDEITKENIAEIVNSDVIDTCCEFDPAFAQRWQRWKQKFLK